ncbi:MAG: hypothetical protein ACXW01_04320 [Methylobacter sp.]
MQTLLNVNQLAAKHQALTVGGVRALIFNEHKNGLAKSGAILRIGRKVIVSEERFLAWIESQNKKGVAQ